MMSFLFIFLNVASIVLLGFLLFFVVRHFDITSARSLFALTFFALAWAVGSFAELLVVGLAAKIFWRDFTQVGSFFVPPASLLFALAYSGVPSRKTRVLARILYPFQSIPLALIATDEFHHLMRSHREIYIGPTGLSSLSVGSTFLGYFFLSINFMLATASIVAILYFIFHVARSMRRQLGFVAVGIGLPIGFAALRVVFGENFGFGIPISCAFAAGCSILLFGVYKLNFLSLEPIARDRVFDVIDEGIIVISVNGQVVDVNSAGLRMLSPHVAGQDSDRPALMREIENFLRKRVEGICPGLAPENVDFSLGDVDGKGARHFNLRMHDLRNSIGTRIGSVGVLRDITHEVLQIEQLKLKAQRDGLTGLYNREALVELFDGLRHLKPGSSCLMVVDIDDFKKLNDQYGHLAGDLVLKAFCDRCRERLRPDDLFGRVGGDEFVVFLNEIDEASAASFAERLVRGVSCGEFRYEDRAIKVTVSAGVAMLDGRDLNNPGAGFVEAFARADRALYKAKSEGKNRIARQGFDLDLS
jgi:diguanylate cyclase (GGDEF)-like protein